MGAKVLKTREDVDEALNKARKILASEQRSDYYGDYGCKVITRILTTLILENPNKTAEELCARVFRLCIDQLKDGDQSYFNKYGINGTHIK